jgi:hypothetical protein
LYRYKTASQALYIEHWDYNDAVDAGGPRARKYGRDISGVALLAMVDALEHAIFTAQQ